MTSMLLPSVMLMMFTFLMHKSNSALMNRSYALLNGIRGLNDCKGLNICCLLSTNFCGQHTSISKKVMNREGENRAKESKKNGEHRPISPYFMDISSCN